MPIVTIIYYLPISKKPLFRSKPTTVFFFLAHPVWDNGRCRIKSCVIGVGPRPNSARGLLSAPRFSDTISVDWRQIRNEKKKKNLEKKLTGRDTRAGTETRAPTERIIVNGSSSRGVNVPAKNPVGFLLRVFFFTIYIFFIYFYFFSTWLEINYRRFKE